ncbi:MULTISPECIES: hypothetical protein [unclassified Microcoleus]|uniref:hypothetical protein n=1 Tax=unclassified Microcoleus TaxID=2642155 RepID=UPI002FD005A4
MWLEQLKTWAWRSQIEGRRKKEEGRGKREEGRGKREIFFLIRNSYLSVLNPKLLIQNS